MKKICALLILCVLSISSYSQTTDYPEGLKVGDRAPLFNALDNEGNVFNLKEALKSGDVVMVFYRGQWCPYCNKQMSNLNDSLSLITEKGARVIAISPETMENVNKTVTKTKASFSVLGDSSSQIMDMYKVKFAVDNSTQARYKTFGIDFLQANGSNGANLPVPATYIIGKNGIIKYVFFDTDYRKRSSVKNLLDNL